MYSVSLQFLCRVSLCQTYTISTLGTQIGDRCRSLRPIDKLYSRFGKVVYSYPEGQPVLKDMISP